ncbi:MAG TPA: NUDIX hydrolase, partial [Patescibacteria group bacterium]|nr:NUDIX hydrolase [Patescibacteria group bacterium]
MSETPKAPQKFQATEGAGILVLARDTGRLLALKRSDHVKQGRTWALAGGLLDPGEAPAHGAAREFREETNYQGKDFDLIPLVEFRQNGFTYNNYLAVVDHEFAPDLDHENEGFKWVNSLNDWPDPAHFGITFLMSDKDSMATIEAEQKAVRDTLKNLSLPSYPPILFHAEPFMKKGQAIQPYKGVVHASETPRGAIASLFPKETRIAITPLEDCEDLAVIVEDREGFLKNHKLNGVITLHPGDQFSQKKPGSTHWVSPDAPPLTQRRFFDKIRCIDDAMLYGIHVLFTPGPVTAAERQEIKTQAATPAGLRKLIAEGKLV